MRVQTLNSTIKNKRLKITWGGEGINANYEGVFGHGILFHFDGSNEKAEGPRNRDWGDSVGKNRTRVTSALKS